jgi:hypothetical protein
MNEYKVKQNQRTKDIVNQFGKKAKVLDLTGKYAQGKYEANRRLALFVDHKTQTLYRVPMFMIS